MRSCFLLSKKFVDNRHPKTPSFDVSTISAQYFSNQCPTYPFTNRWDQKFLHVALSFSVAPRPCSTGWSCTRTAFTRFWKHRKFRSQTCFVLRSPTTKGVYYKTPLRVIVTSLNLTITVLQNNAIIMPPTLKIRSAKGRGLAMFFCGA